MIYKHKLKNALKRSAYGMFSLNGGLGSGGGGRSQWEPQEETVRQLWEGFESNNSPLLELNGDIPSPPK